MKIPKTAYLKYYKKKWDSLANENKEDALRAVISKNELTNYYFDNASKNLLKQVVEIKDNFKVLDYGCGVGRISNWMAPNVKEIIGVDISPEMIDIAKSGAKAKKLENIRFEVIDGESISFKSEIFDLIICIISLKYIIDDGKLKNLMESLSRSIKNEGSLVILDHIDENGPTIATEEYWTTKENWSGLALHRSSNQYISLLKQFNLELQGEYSLFSCYLSRKFKIFSNITGINNYKIYKILIELDLFTDKIFKNYKTKNGYHLLYFKKYE